MDSSISRLQSHGLWCMGFTSGKVYSGRATVFKKEEQKDAMRQKWREILQDDVRKAILSWKKRLRAIYDESGGHINQLFN